MNNQFFQPSFIINESWTNDYQDLQEIVAGQGGIVYKTLHIPSGHIYAKKVIHIRVDSPRQFKRITAELGALSKLKDGGEYIVKVYNILYKELRISIIMEYMEFGSLSQVIKRQGPLTEPIISYICRSMLRGLQSLLSVGIIHRDLKPGNMLVGRQGNVKLCDFGECSPWVSECILKAGHRRLNSQVGTVAYMAPERILGMDYDERSEVWSLGISALELYIGKHPLSLCFHKNSSQPRPIGGLPTPPLSASPKADSSVTENDDVNHIAAIELAEMITNDDILSDYANPALMSQSFLMFLKSCLRKDFSKRPVIRDILVHPFIIRHLDTGRDDLKKFISQSQ
jgi:serine/threonine protein kinase